MPALSGVARPKPSALTTALLPDTPPHHGDTPSSIEYRCIAWEFDQAMGEGAGFMSLLGQIEGVR